MPRRSGAKAGGEGFVNPARLVVRDEPSPSPSPC